MNNPVVNIKSGELGPIMNVIMNPPNEAVVTTPPAINGTFHPTALMLFMGMDCVAGTLRARCRRTWPSSRIIFSQNRTVNVFRR
jgi:hypothetical protein